MKRSEFYDCIWSTPAVKLAEEVGVSGSRIAEICKRHSVPRPPRCCWAKPAAGEHVPRTPLPQPESDYNLKVGTPPPKPSACVAPGVLLRPDIPVDQMADEAQPASALAPVVAAAKPNASAADRPARAARRQDSVDIELVRVISAELQGIRAIHELLQAASARAMHSEPEEARRILTWATAVRVRLEERDPVAALLRLAAALGAPWLISPSPSGVLPPPAQ